MVSRQQCNVLQPISLVIRSPMTLVDMLRTCKTHMQVILAALQVGVYVACDCFLVGAQSVYLAPNGTLGDGDWRRPLPDSRANVDTGGGWQFGLLSSCLQ